MEDNLNHLERRSDGIDTPAVRIGSRSEGGHGHGHGHGSDPNRGRGRGRSPHDPIRKFGAYQPRLSAAIIEQCRLSAKELTEEDILERCLRLDWLLKAIFPPEAQPEDLGLEPES
jgi:hypothetical protein